MKEYNFNETIEYIDGTRDINLEAAQKWAREHGTTFEEDMDKRDLPKRFFGIGSEPVVETPPEQPEPPKPTEEEEKEERKVLRIIELQNFLTATDWYSVRFAETGVEIPDEVKAKRQAAREEISRLRSGVVMDK